MVRGRNDRYAGRQQFRLMISTHAWQIVQNRNPRHAATHGNECLVQIDNPDRQKRCRGITSSTFSSSSIASPVMQAAYHRASVLHGRRNKIAGDAHLRIDNDSKRPSWSWKRRNGKWPFRYLAWKGAKLSFWQVFCFVTGRGRLFLLPLFFSLGKTYDIGGLRLDLYLSLVHATLFQFGINRIWQYRYRVLSA